MHHCLRYLPLRHSQPGYLICHINGPTFLATCNNRLGLLHHYPALPKVATAAGDKPDMEPVQVEY